MTAPAPSIPATSRIALRFRLGAWAGFILWAGAIFWFSSQSSAQIEEINFARLWDKAAHFIAFAAGALPLYCALRWTLRWRDWREVLLTVAILSLYGALDELHQLYTPGRSGADVFDWLADTLGSISGALGIALIYARSKRLSGPLRTPHPAPAGD